MKLRERSLADLKKGESSKILTLNDSELSLKLLDMGCVPGCKVTVNFKAPFGGPISFLICGYNLSLRKEEAQSVKVA